MKRDHETVKQEKPMHFFFFLENSLNLPNDSDLYIYPEIKIFEINEKSWNYSLNYSICLLAPCNEYLFFCCWGRLATTCFGDSENDKSKQLLNMLSAHRLIHFSSSALDIRNCWVYMTWKYFLIEIIYIRSYSRFIWSANHFFPLSKPAGIGLNEKHFSTRMASCKSTVAVHVFLSFEHVTRKRALCFLDGYQLVDSSLSRSVSYCQT